MNPKLPLSETERTEAHRFVRQGKANARTLTRAWVLLKLADGWKEATIAETFAISRATIKNVAHRFARSVDSTWCCMIKCSSDGGKR
jgi:DNA-directed RNA polymerase specialized sigma24 family protein